MTRSYSNNKYTTEFISFIYDNSPLNHKTITIPTANGSKQRIRKTTTLKLLLDSNKRQCVLCGIEGSYFKWNGLNEHPNGLILYTAGGETFLTKDHMIPKSMGGMSGRANYAIMCEKCNHAKGMDILEDGKPECLITQRLMVYLGQVIEDNELNFTQVKRAMWQLLKLGRYEFNPTIMSLNEFSQLSFLLKVRFGLDIKLDDLPRRVWFKKSTSA